MSYWLTWSIVSLPVFVSHTKAISRGHRFGRGSSTFGGVGTWAWWLERCPIPLSPIQGIVGGAVNSVSVHFRVGIVAWSRGAVILPFAMTYTKGVGRGFGVDTPRVMFVLANQARQGIARSWAGVHGSNGPTWFGVVVHHLDSLCLKLNVSACFLLSPKYNMTWH